jgi:MFS family permease
MSKRYLYILKFLSKGWDISFLVLLPFIHTIFHISLVEIGFLSMVYTGVSICSAFFAGHINDTLGNKNTLIFSILLYMVSWLGFTFAHSTWIIWFLFIGGGFSSGVLSPIMDSIVMKQASESSRSKEIGDFTAAGDLGRIAFTVCTSLLVGFLSLQTTAVVFGILAFIFFLYLFLHNQNKEVHVNDDKSILSIGHIDLLRSKEYLFALISGMFDSFSGSSLFIFLPFLLISKNIDIKITGIFTAIFFIGYFTGRLLLGRLGDTHDKAKVLIFAQICMALLITSLVFVNMVWLIAIVLFLLGIVTRGTAPLIKAMVADAIKIDHFEKGYSLYSSMSRSSSSISRPVYSFIGSTFGLGSIFYFSGIIALITIVPAMLFYKSIRNQGE